jgi:hypothetical protein
MLVTELPIETSDNLEHNKKAKDSTQISLSWDGNSGIDYEITNPSGNTTYLLRDGSLGLGLFVEENPKWLKDRKTETALRNNPRRRCIKVIQINSLSGTIRFDEKLLSGALSRRLCYIFNQSVSYRNPYVGEGYENIAIGIGRYTELWSGFRPHKVSDYVEITVYNEY